MRRDMTAAHVVRSTARTMSRAASAGHMLRKRADGQHQCGYD
jgi:hypothetical protein